MLGGPAVSDNHTSNGDSLAWQQSSRLYTSTSLTLAPAGTATDTHGLSAFSSDMQKFHPLALLVTPSMQLAAEKS